MIVKRGKGYGVSVYHPATKGKQWVGTYATMRAAREAERAAASNPRTGRTETCDSFAERWVGDFPRAAPATRRTYTYAVKRFAEDFRGVAIGNLDRPAARRGRRRRRSRTSGPSARCSTTRSTRGCTPGPTRSRTCVLNNRAVARI